MSKKMQTDLNWYQAPEVEVKSETLALRRLLEAWLHVLSPSTSTAVISRVSQPVKAIAIKKLPLIESKDWKQAWVQLEISPESWNALAVVAWRQGLLAGQRLRGVSFFEVLTQQWVFQSRKWMLGWEREKVRHILSPDLDRLHGLRRNHTHTHWQECERRWIEGFGLGFGLWVEASFLERGHIMEWRVLELGRDSKL